MCNNIKVTKTNAPIVKNERERAIELHDDFVFEFDKTLEQLKEIYPRHSRVKKDADLTENVFKMAIYTVLLNMLKQMQIDSTLLSISEFHSKYVPNLPILYRYDFTSDEFKKIIDDSYLNARDKKIAYKYFVEKKSADAVYNELDESGEISDKKTINNNLEKINNTLLIKACRFNKKIN